ncbi:hypothetical protein HPB51_009223 [Rhipicephalus microplus]|uniref:Uncharacterized protein n=1 Tax=Rhipicephalus microplus TaxID=6941 RepID=A0A9J6F0D9_RHIMP|nr:hypothetical protein HPB51_009223 [Rhipicephalus microplus]
MAEEELSEKFARREAIERGEIKDLKVSEGFNPYIEFSRKEIKEYEKHFKKGGRGVTESQYYSSAAKGLPALPLSDGCLRGPRSRGLRASTMSGE